MNYKSPLCSCVICHETKSAAGIFGHYYSKHDAIGSVIMAEIRKKGTDVTLRDPEFVRKNKKQTKKIIKNQHVCENITCSNMTSNSKFCSRSCAAIVSNKSRTIETYKKQVNTLLENKRDTDWKPKEKKSVIKYRTCVECGKIEQTKGRFQSDKCAFCNDSMTYRRQCEFKFNLKDYPDEFDFELLIENGMFNPKKNPKGVSRDHMLSVHYGKTNRISPEIISHPANCRLVLQGDNTRKQAESCITYEQLLIRISEWDAKYSWVAESSNRTKLYRGI